MPAAAKPSAVTSAVSSLVKWKTRSSTNATATTILRAQLLRSRAQGVAHPLRVRVDTGREIVRARAELPEAVPHLLKSDEAVRRGPRAVRRSCGHWRRRRCGLRGCRRELGDGLLQR